MIAIIIIITCWFPDSPGSLSMLISFNSQTSPPSVVKILFSFYRWGNFRVLQQLVLSHTIKNWRSKSMDHIHAFHAASGCPGKAWGPGVLQLSQCKFSIMVGMKKKKKVKVLVAQSCLTLCNPIDCSPPGSSVHGIVQARILEWVAIPFSRGSSQPRDQTQDSWFAGRFFILWATRKALILTKKWANAVGCLFPA